MKKAAAMPRLFDQWKRSYLVLRRRFASPTKPRLASNKEMVAGSGTAKI